ncbi:MAG TPA: hypothetical protein VGE02_01135, partial [Gemmatimonadales bacterium]
MLRIDPRTLSLAAILVTLATAPAARAQSSALKGCEPDGPTPAFMSVEHEIRSGCEWLFKSNPPQYFSAMGYFRTAMGKDPSSAVAPFLLGLAHLGHDQPDSARHWLTHALALDPAVKVVLAARLAEQPALSARLEAFLAPPTAGPAAPRAPAAPEPRP